MPLKNFGGILESIKIQKISQKNRRKIRRKNYVKSINHKKFRGWGI